MMLMYQGWFFVRCKLCRGRGWLVGLLAFVLRSRRAICGKCSGTGRIGFYIPIALIACIGFIAAMSHGAEPARKPVVVARPHKVTLACVENRFFNSRLHHSREGSRAVIDIEPPVVPGERFDFAYCFGAVPENWYLRGHLFDQSGKTIEDKGGFSFFRADEQVCNHCNCHLVVAPRTAACYGVEIWSIPDEHPNRIVWVSLNGKTVYGKEPKP
jgi:hypothetical protein